MTDQVIYDIKDILQVIDKGEYPYNNKVTKKVDLSALEGPGIYAIFHHKELIYIGIFANKGGNVAKTRWAPHIQALTLRGYNSAYNSEKGLQKAIKSMSDRDMIDLMTQKGRWDGSEPNTGGAVTSGRKGDFAHQNWKEFAQKNADTLFDNFEFHYIKLPGLNKKQLAVIEDALVKQNNPVINTQGRRKDSYGKTQQVSGIIRIPDFYNNIHQIEQKVGHILSDYTIFKPLGNNDLYDHLILISKPL